MATERIDFEIRFEGADQAAREAGRVADRIDDMGDAARESTQQAIQFTQRLSAAAGAVQGLASQIGLEGDAAGLIGRIASLTASGAELGGMFGPQGAIVGGITGLAVSTLPALFDALTATVPPLQEVEEETRDVAEAMDAAAVSATSAAEALDTFIGRISTSGRRRELAVLGEQVAQLSDQYAAARDSADAMTRLGAGEIEDQIRRLSARADEIREELADTEANAARAPRRQSGADRAEREREANEEFLGVLREITAELESNRRAEEELAAVREANRQKELEARQGEADRERDEIAAAMERLEAYDDRMDEVSRQAQAASEERIASYQSVTGVVVGGLTDALSAIIAGEKTAEEAFKGLLASFLEFISEQAALKAAYEAAAAIESAATQDWGGFAQHTAAALAYGAVAIAAGAGAAALSQPSAGGQDKPAGPEERDQGEGGGRGDTVINFNSPVVTAGTRAELGRDLCSLVAEADMRGL